MAEGVKEVGRVELFLRWRIWVWQWESMELMLREANSIGEGDPHYEDKSSGNGTALQGVRA